jgi:hypothetical protein
MSRTPTPVTRTFERIALVLIPALIALAVALERC